MYDGILTTRAIRRFTDESVTEEEVMACIKAAVQGPSGGNIQPWQFLVVTDPETKAALGDIYRRSYDRYEAALLPLVPPFKREEDQASWDRTIAASRHLAEHLADAPVLVLALMPAISMTLTDAQGELDVGTPYASVYPAVQNLMLAARSMGIGSTLTTVYRIRQDEVRDLLSIPKDFEVVALVPLGRPSGKFGAARRRPPETVTHWNRFGEKRRSS
ncbi:MAG TPA: nitroreductase family protein [Acidimicrobiia bacterium]|nr:nitroreductase family protein [Acidimicrobiia bacterium]